MPLTFFYIFAVISISSRVIEIAWFYDTSIGFVIITLAQPAAKICVGLI